jgi:hypothetical protein
MSSEMDFRMLCAKKAKERRSLLRFYMEYLPALAFQKIEKEEEDEISLLIPGFDPTYKPPENPIDASKRNKKLKVL